MVSFDTDDELPDVERDTCFIDPLNDYRKYNCKFQGRINDLCLFNGQIVYVQGSMSAGGNINVTDIVTGFTEYSYELKQDAVNKFYKNDYSPYKITVISGPYYDRNSVDLGVFKRILSNVREKGTSLLLLNGPFVDMHNNLVKHGNISINGEISSFEGLFFVMMKMVDEMLKDTKIMVVFVPSLDDVTNMWPLPQPKFYTSADKITKLDIFKNRQLYLMNNPHFFEFNGSGVAICNYDFVKDFVDLAVTSTEMNKVERAFISMIEQRSYFPLIPQAPTRDEKDDESFSFVDHRKMNILAMDVIPDLIIMPSKLEPKAIVVGNTLCVNPGKLFYGNEPGTYAEIGIYPAKVRI